MGTSPINRWTLTYEQWRHLPNEGRDMNHTKGRPPYWHPFCSDITNPWNRKSCKGHISAAKTGAQLGQGLSNFRTGHGGNTGFQQCTRPGEPTKSY